MSIEGFKRKLTAILSADVKGYSRLMGEDEVATVRTLTAYREVMTTLVEHHPGYFFPDLYSRRIASMIPDCRMAVFSGSGGEFINDLGIASAFLK